MSSALGSLYQEGTWTPVLSFGTAGDAAFVYTTQLGKYVRIGNLVKIKFNVVFTVTYTTSAGSLRTTLPFNSASDSITDQTVLGSINNGVMGAGVNPGGGAINAGVSVAQFTRRTQSNGGTTLIGATTITSGATSYTFSGAGKYTAA